MVIHAFPAAKLGALLIKQISKPIANAVKQGAKSSPVFRKYVCLPPAQFYNWCERKAKMWLLHLGQPVNITVLNEAASIDIIPTEFCDILITIYPLGSNLNRVTVNCKPDVPHFGILFHEAIVESNVLAGLVRATAICASRAKRTTLPFYQQYYEERAMSLETVVTKHKHSTTYEDFISRVYSPIATPSPFCVSGSTSSGAGDGPACTGNPSMLAAALLDSHGHSHKPNQRNDSKFRVSASDAARGVWFNNSPDMSQNVESTSISPRPLKKISSSLKSVPRRSLRQEAQDSPPESPQQTTRKK